MSGQHRGASDGTRQRRRPRWMRLHQLTAPPVKPLCTWLVQPGLVIAVEPDMSVTIWTSGPATRLLDHSVLVTILNQVAEFRDGAQRAVIKAARR